MHFSFDLRLSLLVTVAEFFLHKLCKFFSNIFYVHLYISVEAALKQSIFSICEFALPENSRRFSGMLFAKKKRKKFVQDPGAQSAISITESYNKDRSGIHSS